MSKPTLVTENSKNYTGLSIKLGKNLEMMRNQHYYVMLKNEPRGCSLSDENYPPTKPLMCQYVVC